MSEDQLVEAHRHSRMHKEEIARSGMCGCFHCLGVFSPSRIEGWCDEGETALCPLCGVDAVLGDGSELPPIETPFLAEMKSRWFRNVLSDEGRNSLRLLLQDGVDSGPGRFETFEEIRAEARRRICGP